MPNPSHIRLLFLYLLVSSTARLFVMAAGYLDDRVEARIQSTYFTADFLSSHSSYGASRHFDSKPCADRVYASERNRSLRYLFGPTMDKATNYQEHLDSKTKALLQLAEEFDVEPYTPFPAGKVYANLTGISPAVDSSVRNSKRGLTTAFDAYISMPSPYIDRAILKDPEYVAQLEIVRFKTASNPTKMMPKGDFIRMQIKKTGLLEQGRQIRKQQMTDAYLGKHRTQRTYSQRVLEDSKPREGEEVYLLKLPERSSPFYPECCKDPQWTFALVIKFLTYAIPALLESTDNRSRTAFFNRYLNDSGIIPGIDTNVMIQPPAKTSPLFNLAFVQHQKYSFLKANSTVSILSYRKSFIGEDVISPPIRRFISMPGILLGARRILLHGNEVVICSHATINFMLHNYPMNSCLLQPLQMPFRIPKGLADETAKRKEALRQLLEMTELNGLEESFDLEERTLGLASSK